MNLHEISELSNHDLNLKVAKLLGWERFPDKDQSFCTEYWARFENGHFKEDGYLPSYVTDLNACHKMVETLRSLDGPEWFDFSKNLREICGSIPNCINATARQRCEALVMTLTEA